MTASAGQGWTAIGRLAISASRPVGSRRRLPSWTPPGQPVRRTVALPGREPVTVREHPGPAGGGLDPVLLLHGMSWSADINFHGLYEPLGARRPVLAVDLPGHGGRHLGTHFDLDDAADELALLLDALAIERVVVHGFSLGGLVGAQLALRHRDRVCALVVAATGADYTQTMRDRLIWRSLAAAAPAAALLDRTAMTARIFGLSRRDPEFARTWPWLRAELALTPVSTLLATAGAVARCDLRAQLPALRGIPATYLVLTRDPVCQPWMQRQFADAVGAQVLEVDADHFLPLTNPGRYADAVLEALGHLAAAPGLR